MRLASPFEEREFIIIVSDKSQSKLQVAQSIPNESSFSAGLMLGAVLGAGTFFLFGTKKGQKLKDELLEVGKKYLIEWEDELKEHAPEISQKYQEVKERSTQVVEKAKEQIPHLQEKAEEINQRAVEAVEKAKQELPALQQKTAEITAKAAQAIETLRNDIPGKKEQAEKEIEKLQESMVEAAHKAEQMQRELKSTAASIEKKFFFKKGRSLGK